MKNRSRDAHISNFHFFHVLNCLFIHVENIFLMQYSYEQHFQQADVSSHFHPCSRHQPQRLPLPESLPAVRELPACRSPICLLQQQHKRVCQWICVFICACALYGVAHAHPPFPVCPLFLIGQVRLCNDSGIFSFAVWTPVGRGVGWVGLPEPPPPATLKGFVGPSPEAEFWLFLAFSLTDFLENF